MRVFKTSSPNLKLTVYLGKRDFVDYLDHVDRVDGVALVDPEYPQDLKAFVTLACVFRSGAGDWEDMGMCFEQTLFHSIIQVFPALPLPQEPLSLLQEVVLQNLGQNAYPFTFTIPENLPCSVFLHPLEMRKPHMFDFELKLFCAKTAEDKVDQKDIVMLNIRKVQYAPEEPGPQPMVETSRSFLMSDRALHLKVSLDKKLYYHGEPINVNVHVANNSSRTVKKIKVTVRQVTDINMASRVEHELSTTPQYKCKVAKIVAEDQINSCSTFCKTFSLTPELGPNRGKKGVAIDGKFLDEDTNLASSTIMKEALAKDTPSILVSYKVKVKAVVFLGTNVVVELPFVLVHPKPKDEPEIPSPQHGACALEDANLVQIEPKNVVVELPFVLVHPKPKDEPETPSPQHGACALEDTNLVQMEPNASPQLDLVVEDVAHQQLTDATHKERDPCC